MYGLLGEKLSHSFSPQIHSMLGSYDYKLFEIKPEDLGEFMKNGVWKAINVTIPYKKAVIPYLDELSSNAQKIGSVNTVVRQADGSLYGDNTDYDGFLYLIKKNNINIFGKKVLVLGTGGASLAIKAVLDDLGAKKIISISRSGENNYENIENHSDADVIVNTTPVGMYPENLVSCVKLNNFTRLSAVIDIIYNPQKTKLLLDAESLDIPAFSGLLMLVAQAKRASEVFFSSTISDTKADDIFNKLSLMMKNIILIGMPGCGKSTIGEYLCEKLHREFIDTDSIITERAGITIPKIFSSVGEDGFRKKEIEAARDVGKLSAKVIATGGGIVTREENYYALKQNSVIIFINRPLDLLPTDGRPLSQSANLNEMFEKRLPLYRKFCDFEVDGSGSIEEVGKRITEVLKV